LVAALLFALCLGTGALGGLLTASSVDSWYPTLQKPAWNPPNAVFGPVWTALYLMMAAAYFLVWRAPKRSLRPATVLFLTQLGLNLGWSALFFGLRRPDLALPEMVLLLVAIAATAATFRKHSQLAGWLLVPYLLWVSYALSLNVGIVWLNR
jgi:tryptophan-rich sensory protein